MSNKRALIELSVAVLLMVTLMIFIKPVIVKQSSMLPTLKENNYLVLSGQSYSLFGKPHRGDIVVFPYSKDKKTELLIKRVIGLPNDVIQIKNGKVFINGKQEKDKYTKDKKTNSINKTTYKVPQNEIFVMGDNRLNSMDSREIGTIPVKKVIGKVKLRLWPFSKIDYFD